MVGHYDVTPSEFWKMTVSELELIHEAKRSKMINGIHEDSYNEMLARQDELEAQGFEVL